jgi:hypothetical protein
LQTSYIVLLVQTRKYEVIISCGTQGNYSNRLGFREAWEIMKVPIAESLVPVEETIDDREGGGFDRKEELVDDISILLQPNAF